MLKKSILILTSEFPPLPGGIGVHAQQMGKHLSAMGCEVTLIADQRSDAASEAAYDAQQDFSIKHQFKGSKLMSVLGILVSFLLLPIVLFQVWKSWKLASVKLNEGPRIEKLG